MECKLGTMTDTDVTIKSQDQIVMDNLDKLQDENESLKEEMQHLLMTLTAYQDENGKFEREKDEMIKQINFFREKSEESFLKSNNLSNTLSNLKQETIRLTEENEECKTHLRQLREKTKIIQNENKLLRQQSVKYENTLSESRLNENIMSTQLSQLKHALLESQAKYDKLCMENVAINAENAKLKTEIRITSNYNDDDEGESVNCNTYAYSRPTSTRPLTYNFESTDFNSNHLHLLNIESPAHSIKIVEYQSDSGDYFQSLMKEKDAQIQDLTQQNQQLSKQLNDMQLDSKRKLSKIDKFKLLQQKKRFNVNRNHYQYQNHWLHLLPCFTNLTGYKTSR